MARVQRVIEACDRAGAAVIPYPGTNPTCRSGALATNGPEYTASRR